MKPIDWDEQARLDEAFISHITDPEQRARSREQMAALREWHQHFLASLPKMSPWQMFWHDVKAFFRPLPKAWHYRHWWMAESWNARTRSWE